MKQVRRILVPIDESPHNDVVIRQACRLAKAVGAKITGVSVFCSSVLVKKPSIKSYYDLPSVRTLIQEGGELAGVSDTTVAKFHLICDEYEVEHRLAKLSHIPVEGVLASSKLHDLVVAGTQQRHPQDGGGYVESSIEPMLNSSVTPVLAIPPMFNGSFARVTVAYDGSMQSVRALKDFVAMRELFQDCAVQVVTAHESIRNAEHHSINAAVFLTEHGFDDVASHQVTTRKLRVEDMELLYPSDLVVAGIHSTGIDEGIGSFTHELLESQTAAVLLSH